MGQKIIFESNEIKLYHSKRLFNETIAGNAKSDFWLYEFKLILINHAFVVGVSFIQVKLIKHIPYC